MQLSPDQLSELESLAIQAATRAGEMIQSKTKHDHLVLSKEGGNSLASQVVTAVDLESQRLILDTLKDTFARFELGLLTEESPDDSSRHRHDHFWCIDPLDGTLAFSKGSPGYSVSIALVARDGTPRIGVVFDPVNATLYQAVHRRGARINGQPWKIPPSLSGAPLTLMIDDSFIAQANAPIFRNQLEDLAAKAGFKEARIIDHAGAVLNACGVVEHAPALYFKFPKTQPGGGSLWDFAATTCLFHELGLPASDIHGNPLALNPKGDTFMNRNGVLFASQPALASAASGFVKRFMASWPDR
jgi:3'(2'), 5'-bisphosphate nucleotidase/myo-inositol-1(or 4)-monophosphatase